MQKGFVSVDPITRHLTWMKDEWNDVKFLIKSQIPQLCDAGSLIMTKNGLLIIELPAD